MTNVFMSYARADAAKVNALAEALQETGARVGQRRHFLQPGWLKGPHLF